MKSASGKLRTLKYTAVVLLSLTCAATYAGAQDSPAPTKVLLGGIGTPRDMIPVVLEQLTDFLKSNKVQAKQITGEPKTRDEYLEILKSSGGQTLLYVNLRSEQPGVKVDFGGFLNVKAFDPKGTLLWEENISRKTCSGIKDMANQMQKRKFTKHLTDGTLRGER